VKKAERQIFTSQRPPLPTRIAGYGRLEIAFSFGFFRRQLFRDLFYHRSDCRRSIAPQEAKTAANQRSGRSVPLVPSAFRDWDIVVARQRRDEGGAYGRGTDVGRGRGIGVALGVKVGVAVGLGVIVAIGVAVTVAVGVGAPA
jgi:hypothetical protein